MNIIKFFKRTFWVKMQITTGRLLKDIEVKENCVTVTLNYSQRRNFLILLLFQDYLEGVIENDSICSPAKDIPYIIVHCLEENTIKNIIHH